MHTRQAYPPKTMPCTLLLASDPVVKAILHPRETSDQDSPIPASSAAAGAAGAAAAGATAPSSPSPAAVAPAGAGGGVALAGFGAGGGGGGQDAGPPVGLSMVLDCRVACTVELLWDVDLTLLGKEMGLHPKL